MNVPFSIIDGFTTTFRNPAEIRRRIGVLSDAESAALLTAWGPSDFFDTLVVSAAGRTVRTQYGEPIWAVGNA